MKTASLAATAATAILTIASIVASLDARAPKTPPRPTKVELGKATKEGPLPAKVGPAPTEVENGNRTNDGLARLAQTTDGALARGLASEDEATRIAAVEAAVSSTEIAALDDLERFELARDPGTAPTVIHAIALLGASAEGAKREDAATTLARWLRDERKREGADVPGNISNLVEALGDIGGRSAVEALGDALDHGDLPLHVETLASIKLGELGDARGRGPVERFATRVAALPAADGIDEELRVEAIAAAKTTLSKI